MARAGRQQERRARMALVAATASVVVGGLAVGLPAAGAEGGKERVEWFLGLGAPESLAKERTKAINGVAKAFERRNREIDLVTDITNGDVHVALGDLVASGDVPDVIGPMTLRDFGAFSGSFADLTPLVEAAGFDLGAYPAGLLDAYRDADGRLLGLPFGAYPSVMYYDRELFDEAGLAYPPAGVGQPYVMPDETTKAWDFETVAEIAKLLTVDADGHDATSRVFDPTRIVQFGFVDQFPDVRRSATFLGGPGSLVDVDAAGEPVVTIPQGWRDGVGWLRDATWDAHVLPTATDVGGELLANNPFGSGHVAMAAAPLWYTCCIADEEGTRLKSWDLGVMPVGLTGSTTSPLEADAIAIGATSADPDAAFAVLQYLLDDKRPAELWQVAPASNAKRTRWYRDRDRIYGGTRDWDAADAMLGYPDVPSYLADVPSYDAVVQRLGEFRSFIGTEEAASLDLDAELDRLTADLQALVDGG